MMNDLNKVAEVFCVFKTQMGKEFEIPANPLNIKTANTNEDLNTLVKEILLKMGKETSDNFDFILNKEIIRGDIKSHLLKHNIEGERNVVIEYTSALNFPQPDKKTNTENWLNCFKIKENKILACFYDSSVKVFDFDFNEERTFNVIDTEDEFVRNTNSFCFLDNNDKELMIASNFFGELYATDASKPKTRKLTDIETTINCFYTNPINASLFCSGDIDGTVALWNYQFENGKLLPLKNKQSVHNGSIIDMIWLNEQELLTIGSDDQMIISDINTLKSNYNIYLKDITASTVDYCYRKTGIMTGHVNGSIRFFDERERKKTSSMQFKSHKLLVSSIASNSERENVFVSGCYEGKIKVWDFRMTLPLYTIDSHFGKKIFDLKWLGWLIRL